MTYIRYTPANLAEARDRTFSTHSALQSDREGMTAFLRKHLGTEWQGAASDAHQGLQHEWDSSCDAIHQILHNLGRALDACHANASATEQACIRTWTP